MEKYIYIVNKQKQGIKLSKENSDKLYVSATILAEREQFGTSISLLVLSVEEIIKSFALCLEIFLGNKSEVKKIIKDSNTKAIDSYLFNHIDKQKLAKTILSDLITISKFLNIFSLLNIKGIKRITDILVLKNHQIKQVESAINSLENYNDFKNKGFYVDKIDGEWLTPSKFCEKDYNNCKKDIELIRELFSERIDTVIHIPDSELCLLAEAFGIDSL